MKSQPQVAEIQKLHDAREQLSNEQMAMLEKRESIWASGSHF